MYENVPYDQPAYPLFARISIESLPIAEHWSVYFFQLPLISVNANLVIILSQCPLCKRLAEWFNNINRTITIWIDVYQLGRQRNGVFEHA